MKTALPGLIVGVSWSGFWLYLAGLDLLGVRTRTAYSVAAYALIAAGLGWVAWTRRETLTARLSSPSRRGLIWVVAAALLSVLFAYGALVNAHGSLAHRLFGVFVISTIPVTVAVVSLSARDLSRTRSTLVGLGLVFTVINVITLRHGAPPGSRFSPIASLDPISASLVSAIGCASALTIRSTSTRATVLRACICFTLAGSTMLNGARGPVVALIIAAVCLLLVERRAAMIVAVLGVALGLATGSKLEPALSQPSQNTRSISSISIRREWLSTALHKFPQKPILGHGIGTLVDDTPEAVAMGVRGQLVYPHNDAVEALYSLGAVGGILFALLLGLPAVSLWRDRASLTQPMPQFAFVLLVFAFAESNFSGELGTDGILWSLAGLVVLGLDDQFL